MEEMISYLMSMRPLCQGALISNEMSIDLYSTCVAHTTLVSHHGLANIGICSSEELINFPIRMRCAVKMKRS